MHAISPAFGVVAGGLPLDHGEAHRSVLHACMLRAFPREPHACGALLPPGSDTAMKAKGSLSVP